MSNSSNLQFYLDRAAQARSEADAATLDHVRERCHRSESAWSKLAQRAARSEKLRADEALRKASQTAAEAGGVDDPADDDEPGDT